MSTPNQPLIRSCKETRPGRGDIEAKMWKTTYSTSIEKAQSRRMWNGVEDNPARCSLPLYDMR